MLGLRAISGGALSSLPEEYQAHASVTFTNKAQFEVEPSQRLQSYVTDERLSLIYAVEFELNPLSDRFSG